MLSLILKDLLSAKHVIRCLVLFSNQDVFLADLQKATLSSFRWVNAFKNRLLGLWGSSVHQDLMMRLPEPLPEAGAELLSHISPLDNFPYASLSRFNLNLCMVALEQRHKTCFNKRPLILIGTQQTQGLLQRLQFEVAHEEKEKKILCV